MKNGSTALSVLLLWTALLMRAQLHAANPPRGELPEIRLANVVQLAAVVDPADGDSSAGRRANHQTPEGARNDPGAKTFADNRPLRISRVTADKERVEIYDAVELTAEIAATYDNPFDPDQIAVNASVTTPDGKVLSVPGFLYAPMRLETEALRERVRPAGAPSFRVRYTLASVGSHRLILQATDRSGTVRSEPVTVRATKGDSPGFIRVGRSSEYFAFDNGKPYFAVGENLCWSRPRAPIADYTKWLNGLGGAGGNWARLWLAYNEKGLEWMPAPTPKPGVGAYLGLGRYALDNAWRLDEIVRLARANGIYLMFCLGTYGEFTEGGRHSYGIS